MKLKLIKPLAFFDLETTGADAATDMIVEIAIYKLNVDGTKEIKTKRIKPTIPISAEAEGIHGISELDVATEPTFEAYAKSLEKYLEGCDLGGFNNFRFDMPLLVEEFARVGITFPKEGVNFVDAMAIFHKKEKRDLTAAYKFFCGKELEGAHGAEADITATYEVFEAQLDRYDDLGESVAEIQEFCTDGKEIIDFAGKITRDEKGDLVFTFGKHEGKKIVTQKHYAEWMLKGGFTHDTKRKLRKILSFELK